ncbi:hypothetical protein EW093_01485 [Thiospirochaeta perfilievii]|uniref:Cell shape-determining protein n=1 Tax=Thiospirochaeta perfilievii TaxID=252967 RepID=A0A5C1Q7X9_9SPIO|nr:hypothetical protein [Thiospirochaeta perfilievii]QEN03428.1 hypothetical protein EW093_01485 [Thiospirochaeta perfilievii]
MKKKFNFIIYSCLIVLFAAIYYLSLPVLNIMFYGLPFFVTLIGITILIVESNKNGIPNIPGLIITALGLVFLTIVPLFTTPAIGRSDRYMNIIGEVEESLFIEDISPVDVDKIRLVDQDMASKLGDKTIGQDPALGSSSYVGNFNIQTYRGELYWVAPLLHRSFFKWLSNKEGSKGYIMVSATNPQDVRLVQDKGFIKYQPDAYFSQDLKRHIYFNGFINKGFTDYTFEIDDDGKPYWVISQYKKVIGYSGKDVEKTILIDAQNGTLSSYTVDKTPKWVDRIQPEEFVIDQVNNWGKFKKGFWNSILAEEGVQRLTPGISLVYGKDGVSYWYSGVTSVGADDSTIGFILVNSRTKEFKYYKQSGATETAAMGSAEGKVQEKGYYATFPIMYNIVGRPTYVLSLKDNAGLIKMISMISVEDYTVLGIGETTEEALRNYKSALKRTLSGADIRESLNIKAINGVIERINSDIFKGDSFYYFTLQGVKNRTFTLTSQISKDIILTEPNDYVEIKYEESDSDILEVSEYIRR